MDRKRGNETDFLQVPCRRFHQTLPNLLLILKPLYNLYLK